jgi:hypothetical protein
MAPEIAPDALPLHALASARPHLPTLERLGCHTWGHLRKLPRGGLARRFGADVLVALDQAYGLRPDIYPWIRVPEVFDVPLELAAQVESEPSKRDAQRRLAWEVTALVHGDAAADAVVAASAALFGNGDLFALDSDTVAGATTELPQAKVSADTLVTSALVDSGLCSSLSDARRAIQQGGVSINNEAVAAETDVVGDRTLAGGVSILRRGKKTLAALIIGK